MTTSKLFLLVLVCGASLETAPYAAEPETALQATVFDFSRHWDASIPLANPHKGWYHHFPDNHPGKYVIAKDADLLDFPGMDHLYIRLAWSYLEPQEGDFHWEVIDRSINKWVAYGLGISFRISCKETSTDRIEQQFATPKWVMEAGAKGGYYRKGQQTGPDGPWEPVFDDPVFMDKLESFLKAFAARYDGKPWLRYVDIGSIGDWGEGHTSSGSRLKYGFDQRRPHVDLHCKYFQKTQLVISDDFVYSLTDQDERQRMHQYIMDREIAYRDDSILVDYYVRAYSDTWTVRSPAFFADTWRRTPQVLELQHYGAVKRDGNWIVQPGSSAARHGDGNSGPDYFRGALDLLHATYIGYHGDAREWLDDNPEVTVELLNRCGYWYFPHRVMLPEDLSKSDNATIGITWENRGVAPAYHPYQLLLRLKGPETQTITVDARNMRWMPCKSNTTYTETYRVPQLANLKPGKYDLAMKLYCPNGRRPVLLALESKLKDKDDFYTIGSFEIR